MTISIAPRRHSGTVVLVVFAMLSACLVATVARSSPASAQLVPYSHASIFRVDGVLNSAPATVTLSDIGTVAFVLGSDDGIWWATQNTNWQSLGMPTLGTIGTPIGIVGSPAVVSFGAGRIDLFVRGGDDKLWQRFTTCSGCQWSPWLQPLGADGTLASPPAVTSSGNGRIDVVVQGTDKNFWQRSWNITFWSPGWINIGSPPVGALPLPGEPAAITTFTVGRLDVFIRGADNKLWQTFFINNTWQGWFLPPGTETGKLDSPPAADWWNDAGRAALTIFVRGVDTHLYQTTFEGGSFGPFTVEGAQGNVFINAPAVSTTLGLQPTVLIRGTDNRCYMYLPG